MATSLYDQAKRVGNFVLNPAGGAFDAAATAGRSLAAGLTGGAATGVFPQMPAGGTPALRSLASQAQVRALDNLPANAGAIAAAPVAATPAAPAAAVDATPPTFQAAGSVTDLGSTGTTSAERTAQYNRDATAQRSLADRALELSRQGVGVPATPGMGVINGDWANRNAAFNAQANVGTLASRGAAPGRNGAAVFRDQVAAAGAPLAEMAAQQQLQTQQAGATQRAQIQEQGLASRAALSDARQQEANSIDRARLGIDALKATHTGVPAGYRAKADGTGLEPIPGGPADPNTPKGKNTLNDTQAKALQFGTRMLTAGQTLDRLAAGGVNQPGLIKRAADTVGLGAAANFTQSAEQQQVEQAQRDFINATLRRESGAAISESEFTNARQQYFPQPGDSPQVIEQKRKNRELATQGFLAEVPDQQNRVQQVLAASGQPAAAAGAAGAAAAPGLPAGMSRQVGTSGGKPVYEDAQGRRFVGD